MQNHRDLTDLEHWKIPWCVFCFIILENKCVCKVLILTRHDGPSKFDTKDNLHTKKMLFTNSTQYWVNVAPTIWSPITPKNWLFWPSFSFIYIISIGLFSHTNMWLFWPINNVIFTFLLGHKLNLNRWLLLPSVMLFFNNYIGSSIKQKNCNFLTQV